MEKTIKIIRLGILITGIFFFIVGFGIGFKIYSDGNKASDEFVLPIVFAGIGLFDIIGVSIWMIISGNKEKREKWLFENGMRIQAKFNSVEKNRTVSVNKKHPYFILCQWKDPITADLHLFKSRNIWFNPEEHLDSTKHIQVFCDPANMKSYVVDTSFLPKAD